MAARRGPSRTRTDLLGAPPVTPYCFKPVHDPWIANSLTNQLVSRIINYAILEGGSSSEPSSLNVSMRGIPNRRVDTHSTAIGKIQIHASVDEPLSIYLPECSNALARRCSARRKACGFAVVICGAVHPLVWHVVETAPVAEQTRPSSGVVPIPSIPEGSRRAEHAFSRNSRISKPDGCSFSRAQVSRRPSSIP